MKTILLLLTTMSLWFMNAAEVRCPILCECSGIFAKCTGIASLTGFPLPDPVIHIHINAASLKTIPANKFANHTRSIRFENSHIGEIQSSAFKDMNSLNQIRFKSSRIERIKPCAFFSIHGGLNISISLSIIVAIEGGAFTNITNMTELTISHSNFMSGLPHFSFTSISTKKLKFQDVDFRAIKTAAFYDLHDIESLIMNRVTVKSIHAGAFYGLTRVRSVHIKGMSHFTSLEHRTLTELHSATVGVSGAMFRFESTLLGCDCKSAPLIDYFQSAPKSVSDSVRCLKQQRSLFDVNVKDVCPSYDRRSSQYCADVTLKTPVCSDPVSSSTENIKLDVCPIQMPNASTRNGYYDQNYMPLLSTILFVVPLIVSECLKS